MGWQLRMLDNETGLVEITSRVQHGRFLLLPSPEVNELILGVLGRAQAKYEGLIHAFIFMSNHLLEQRQFITAAVRQIEEQTARIHRQSGTEPVGARVVRNQQPQDKPKDFKPSPAPMSHAATPEEFLKMQCARAARVEAYRAAAERFKKGEANVRLPPGCFPPPLPYVANRAPP